MEKIYREFSNIIEGLGGLASCSPDCDSMWQTGVDVLPEFPRQGIASVLTERHAVERLKSDKVLFYCCLFGHTYRGKV